MTNKPCNRLCWSPSGRYIVFAGIGVSEREIIEYRARGRVDWSSGTRRRRCRCACASISRSLSSIVSVSCTDVAWSPNGHFCVGMSCYSETSKQDVLLHAGDDQ